MDKIVRVNSDEWNFENWGIYLPLPKKLKNHVT